ncbi:MAG TPA: hypothetical protein VG895_04705 [Patescibacteria group bacterium]|nr:hypothetical protein [Patescibacteria group bacterium]
MLENENHSNKFGGLGLAIRFTEILQDHLPIPRPKVSLDEEKIIIEKYTSGKHSKEIGRETGHHPSTILDVLHRNNIEVAKAGRPKKNK